MHPEALTEEGKKLFPLLSKFPDFYLAGGTALALQIGHRISVDFDMFSDQELPRTLLAKIRRVFSPSPVYPSVNNPEQLNATVAGVKMTFFCYQYPPILPLVEHQGVKMVSLPEIAAMKAFAIGQRGTFRDYIDMYFLLKERHVNLPQIISLADKRFSAEFNHRLFLEQLLYLEDVREVHVDFLRNPVSRAEVARFLEDTIRSFPL